MAVKLTPQAGGSVVPEAAAFSTNINRQDQNIGGEIVGVFSANLNWKVTDYLVDASGKKIAVVQTDPSQGPMGHPGAGQDRQGSLYLDPAAFAAAMIADPGLAAAYEKVADFEDGLVRAELVARKLLA
jgi:hypothetical protein